jgi:cytochrome c oxidase assembly protein subunit 15
MTEPTSSSPASAAVGLHRFATFLACFVVLLITAGALVTSKQAGLSVPDWPLSYGGLNPPRWWQIENVRAEHGHRLIAGTVAMLTVLLAVWMHRREPRRWVRRLSLIAVVAVLSQALLGGLTVLFFLPTPISVSHAGLAQVFLCLVVTMAVVTSPSWPREPGWRSGHAVELARWTTGGIYLQILMGAVMRHTDSGLAIPDFPLAFGKLIPPHWSFGIGIHFAHRLGAVMVLSLIIATFVGARKTAWRHRGIRIPAVLTGKAVLPNTVHVGVGATLLATSLVLSLNSWRHGAEGAAG